MFFWSLILDSYRNTQRSNIGVWNIYTLDLISTSALCGVGIKQCSPEVAIFSWFDTNISFEDPEFFFSKSLEVIRRRTHRRSSFCVGWMDESYTCYAMILSLLGKHKSRSWVGQPRLVSEVHLVPLFTSFVFQIHVNSLMFIMKKLCQFFNFYWWFFCVRSRDNHQEIAYWKVPSFCNTCVALLWVVLIPYAVLTIRLYWTGGSCTVPLVNGNYTCRQYKFQIWSWDVNALVKVKSLFSSLCYHIGHANDVNNWKCIGCIIWSSVRGV